MAILVTGGAGFVGSHLVEELLARGEQVVVLDDFNDYYDPASKERNLAAVAYRPELTLVRGNVAEPDAVEAAFAAAPVRAVVHLAARAGVRPSLLDPLLYERTNVQGTMLLLDASRRAEVERFIFAGSSSVYGADTPVPFREDAPADRPISPYAATKRAAELACYTYHHLYGLPVACLRLFTVYGPRQRPDLAIHGFTRRIARGEPIRVFGDGRSARDYTYVADTVAGFLGALDRREPLGYEIVNLGNSHPISLETLIVLLQEVIGREAIIERVGDQPGDVPITYADISKAERLLGYRPKVTIRDGLERFYSWYVAEQRQPVAADGSR
ncbi:MAG TPA: NAD-dependent epimerase/dehydratase family protein [Ktedonobacterales bacterium]|nr:NAD-dependent epimerase/dehydratase family protein [Ktedonobacterales bacterium]